MCNDAHLTNKPGEKMEKTIFCGVHLCKEAGIENSQFINVAMSGVLFDNIDMTGAKFNNINMSKVNFHGIGFNNARFDAVGLNDVEITDCEIDGLKINGILVTDMLDAYNAKKGNRPA